MHFSMYGLGMAGSVVRVRAVVGVLGGVLGAAFEDGFELVVQLGEVLGVLEDVLLDAVAEVIGRSALVVCLQDFVNDAGLVLSR